MASEPMDAPGPRLRLAINRCLATGLDGVDRELGGRQLPVLLAVLASQRHRAVPREELAEALWGEDLPHSWEPSLRVAISKIRAFLVAAGFSADALRSAGGGYQVRLGGAVASDLESASHAVAAAERERASARPAAARDLARQARSALDAPLLPGSEGPWVDNARRQARALLVRTLETEAAARSATGEYAAAVAAAERALQLEPFHESAHRALLRAHALAGNKAESLRCYERCRQLLAEELGVGPAPATEAVYRQVLRDEPLSSRWPAAVSESEPHAARDQLAAGREAVAEHDWERAFTLLSRADAEAPLEASDLEGLGEAALWTGRHSESVSARQRAHDAYLKLGDQRAAARVALALASNHGLRSQLAPAEGWFRTAARLLEGEAEGPEHGFLASVAAIVLFETGELGACLEQARRALDFGQRFEIPDLQALGITFQGLALARQDRASEALALLDEGMALASGGRLSPLASGMIFCRTIRTSLDLFDYRRAAEWIEAVHRSADDTGFGGYPGDCSAHLAEALEARGSWDEAEREAEKACAACEGFEISHVGLASYTLGQIYLQRGDLHRAEAAFHQANAHGVIPQPGLALLELAEGDAAGALTGIRAWLDGTPMRLARARALPASVEIALAAGDPVWAHMALDELEGIAEAYSSAALLAATARARGAIKLAEGDTAGAIANLREAADRYRQAEMPFQVARARQHLAEALLASGDRTGAGLEIEAAGRLYDRLGANPIARHQRRREQ